MIYLGAAVIAVPLSRALGLRTHLVVTPAGVLNAHHELGLDRKALEAEADEAHAPGDVGACVASGSFDTAAMVVAPCSMKTLAAVAHGLSDNLLTRAADVTLKEVAPDEGVLQRTVSHFHWGTVEGFDADGMFALRRADGQRLRWDPATARPAK